MPGPSPAAGAAYVIGTFDTKAAELHYVSELLRAAGVPTVRVDVGTRSDATDVDITAQAVARCHPGGAAAVLQGNDRGQAVTAMTAALRAFMATRSDVAGVIGLGGSGGTAIVTPAMRDLPLGVPKLMVSTLASGNTAPYVDVYDLMMLFPVTDIAGLNRLSRLILGNAAHALAGMILRRPPTVSDDKPALGITMFGVTTPCVQQISASLSADFDCQVFHATGVGGRAMEALVAAGMLSGVVDITTTEAADYLCGGVCSAGEQRFDAIVRTGIPWVGSCGALDMVNFWAMDTVPERYRRRRLHAHNANVTLMRTTAEELRAIGTWIAGKLNASPGPVRWLLPEQGLSAIDAPGQVFHDPAADAALFAAIESAFVVTDRHRLVRVPHHINDPAFAQEAVRHVRELLPVGKAATAATR
jgi:uncharacterized protein (UPF0261 family)